MDILFVCAVCALMGTDSSVTKNQLITASTFDLVITEVLADPDPPQGLPAQEFCEIYNRSTLPVNLAGWTFFDGSNRILPAVTINPGEYVIICNDDDTALFSGYGKYAAVTSISLTNTGEKIAIRDPLGNPVDSVIYSDSWLGSSFKKDGGWSLEKVDPDLTCPVSTNWQPSLNPAGGTPGAVNSVDGSILDDEPPLLLRSFCPDSISVVLLFNEPLDPTAALELQHYYFSQTMGQVAAAFEDAFLKRVRLTLDSAIVPGLIYTVSVSEITDCSGNKILSGSETRFGIGDTSINDGLIINEVLFNPYTNGFDFVELFHRGPGIMDLSTIKIESLDLETGITDESEKISEEPFLLFPGDYLVLTENPSTVAMQYRSSYPFNFFEISNLPGMNVDEGHLALSANEKRIDHFHYFENYHFELLEDYKGISLEKINPVFHSADPSSWHSAAAAAGFATPGLKNSQYMEVSAGDKQIGLSPELFSPDNDGKDDVITITLKTGIPGYISNTWIYNADGQLVFEFAKNTLLSTDDAFVWDGISDSGVRAPVGIYVALVEIVHLTGDVKKYRLPFVLAVQL